jgi:axial budding pattern protein 2
VQTSSGSNLSLSPDSLNRSGNGFSTQPSGLGRIIDTHRFSSVDEEDEGSQTSIHDAPYDHGEAHGELRLMPSREKFAVSPTQSEMPQASRTPSEEAIMETPADAFDDADEEAKRESTLYAPSQLGDLQALGYPADSIVFGSPPNGRVSLPAAKRVSSIRAIPQETAVMSPPLPMGKVLQQSLDRNRQTTDGRYIALVNETFNLHPALNPPPSVSLSAATWTAQAPSTYRAERTDGTALPTWLRWDTKEFTLWGIPPANQVEETIEVRIMERIPKEKRKHYDSSVWEASTPNERQVGHVVIQ